MHHIAHMRQTTQIRLSLQLQPTYMTQGERVLLSTREAARRLRISSDTVLMTSNRPYTAKTTRSHTDRACPASPRDRAVPWV